MKYFYIHDNVFSARNDLPTGTRIKTMNLSDFFPTFKDGDGPYKSLKELRQNSSIFKKLNRLDQRRAQKICEKKYIIHIVELVAVKKSTQDNLGNAAFEMLDHIISGKIKNNKSSGTHLFDSKFHKIEEVTKPTNSHGIWEGKISVLDSKSNKWVPKEALTTFFPNSWNKANLLVKLETAFLNKKMITDTKAEGITDCGIKVIFIFKNNKVISVYPLYT